MSNATIPNTPEVDAYFRATYRCVMRDYTNEMGTPDISMVFFNGQHPSPDANENCKSIRSKDTQDQCHNVLVDFLGFTFAYENIDGFRFYYNAS